jgi:DNA-binding transcriptional regulator/RsmH inhibitor MraZ
MADAAVNGAVEFTGSFEHGVDGSFRIMLPSAWRLPDKDAIFTMIPWPLKRPDHLLVLPPDRWQVALQRLKESFSLTSTSGAVVQRAVASSAVRKKLDDTGRLCLGEKLAGIIHVTNKASLVGCLDKFEIWEPGRLSAAKDLINQVPDEMLEGLMI